MAVVAEARDQHKRSGGSIPAKVDTKTKYFQMQIKRIPPIILLPTASYRYMQNPRSGKDEKYEVCVRSADIALSAPVAPSNTLVSLWDFVPMILQLNNIGLVLDGHVVNRLHQNFKLDSFGIVAEARRPTQEGGGSIPAKVDTKPNTSKCRSREYHPSYFPK